MTYYFSIQVNTCPYTRIEQLDLGRQLQEDSDSGTKPSQTFTAMLTETNVSSTTPFLCVKTSSKLVTVIRPWSDWVQDLEQLSISALANRCWHAYAESEYLNKGLCGKAIDKDN